MSKIEEVDGGKGWHLHSKFYLDSARAAIAAMREPTKAMEGAAHDEMEGYGLGRYTPIISAYRGMIDAALREEGR